MFGDLEFRRLAVNKVALESTEKYVPLILHRDVGPHNDSVVWHLKYKTRSSGWVVTIPLVGRTQSVGIEFSRDPPVDPAAFTCDHSEYMPGDSVRPLPAARPSHPEAAYFSIANQEEPLLGMPTSEDPTGSYFWDEVTRRHPFGSVELTDVEDGRSLVGQEDVPVRCAADGGITRARTRARRAVKSLRLSKTSSSAG